MEFPDGDGRAEGGAGVSGGVHGGAEVLRGHPADECWAQGAGGQGRSAGGRVSAGVSVCANLL